MKRLECPTRNDTTDYSLISSLINSGSRCLHFMENKTHFISILNQLPVFKCDFCEENGLNIDTVVQTRKGQIPQIIGGRSLSLCGKCRLYSIKRQIQTKQTYFQQGTCSIEISHGKWICFFFLQQCCPFFGKLIKNSTASLLTNKSIITSQSFMAPSSKERIMLK